MHGESWKQREIRDGVKLVWVELTLPYDNDKDILAAYEKAITPRTKVIHVTHVINWTGQIMPRKSWLTFPFPWIRNNS